MEDKIIYLKASELTAKNQVRLDKKSPTAIEHIEKLAKSIGAKIKDGEYYGVREPLTIIYKNEIPIIHKGENRWLAATKVDPEMLLPCIIKSYDDALEAHLDQVTENSLRRGLNIFETAKAIAVDKEHGLKNDEIADIYGLSNKTVISKYLGVFKLSKAKQNIIKESYISDLNMISKLNKVPEESIQELRKLLQDGMPAKKAISKVLNKDKPEKPKTFPLSFSEDTFKKLCKLVDIDFDDLTEDDKPSEIISDALDQLMNPKRGLEQDA